MNARRLHLSCCWRSALLLLALIPGLAAQDNSSSGRNAALNRGEEISSAVSSVTGTSISPLLGVCLFGVYQYARAPVAARASLPFYARPHIWVPLMILLALVFLKDTIGSTIPLLKKPLDALEVLVMNKASLVLLAVPFMFDQLLPLVGIKSASGLVSFYEPVAYAADFEALHTARQVGMTTLVIAAGLMVTFVVWLVGHAIDVLVLLTPIPFIDLVFKGVRTAILLAIVVTSLIDRRLGLIVALAVIAVAALLFSWTLRIAIVGSVFSWDLLRLMAFGRRERSSDVTRVYGFTAAKIHGLPRYLFGRLERNPNGILEFRFRRFGFGPTRRVRLEDAAAYQIGRGMVYPCIILPDQAGYTLQFRLPPRYNGMEEDVRRTLGMSAIRDIRLRKGLAAFWRWAEGNTPAPREA